MKKIAINQICIILGTVLALITATILLIIYLETYDIFVMGCLLFYIVAVILCVIFFVSVVRHKLSLFSDELCNLLDDMLSFNLEELQCTDEDNLLYKIQHRVSRLYDVIRENHNAVSKERTDLQELISDISHQVKTPIANLKMSDATWIEQSVPSEKQQEFYLAMKEQLDKLDFLMQSMIKTSRLETGMISLDVKQQAIYDTLAAALGGILLNAEQKKIDVTVECPESILVIHDKKWTTEALFNILDNAIKYTPMCGKVKILVSRWEMYAKIDITDTGIGIPEKHQGTIFKRFYRENVVHDAPGVGIGLYLTREIITQQGGFIRVASEVGRGSTFSVFLPCSKNVTKL